MTEALPKKLAVVNDFSGFGHCSLTVALPVISVMGIWCCPVPTSVLSSHMGYPDYSFWDFTGQTEEYLDKWEKLGLKFDGIYTGFFASEQQIEMILGMAERFCLPGARLIVDPVLGDHGRPYASCTPALCEAMRTLAARADILTPNLTEACLLTGTAYREDFSDRELEEMAGKLAKMGPEQVVITGAEQGDILRNAVYDRGFREIQREPKIGLGRSGSGDVFSSVIAADALRGTEFPASVRKASAFVARCIRRAEEYGMPAAEGACIEEFLGELR